MMQSVPSVGRWDVHQTITDKIVAAIEAGPGKFVMPWHSRGATITRPVNAATQMAYRGVNVVALWAEAMLCGFGSGSWASFRQWRQIGAQVRKGEHGTLIVFYRQIGSQSDNDEDEARQRFVARASYVFNADQVDGWVLVEPLAASPIVAVAEAESLIAVSQADIRHGGDAAFYSPGKDFIQIPERERFRGTPTSSPTESYYATLLHELTHWTGAAHRLNRTFGKEFGNRPYAFEELVADLGAAFLCADLGIANEPRADHAAYVGHWLQILRDDARAVFTAARDANRAAGFLYELTGRQA